MNIKRKIVKIIETSFLIIVIACVCCNIITGLTGKSHVFGIKPMIVMSGSMEPTIKTYQLVLTVPVSGEEVHVNDIVTYKAASGITVIHRVIDITEQGFVFKGDNNSKADEMIITADQIGYKVIWH